MQEDSHEKLNKFLPNLPPLLNSTHFNSNRYGNEEERKCVKRPQLINIQEIFTKNTRIEPFSLQESFKYGGAPPPCQVGLKRMCVPKTILKETH